MESIPIIKTQGMIERAIENAEEGELIIFPETALILSENDNKSFMEMVNFKSKEKNLTLLAGIVERETNYKIRNRLQSFGEIDGFYDKVKLVPFGEFIPLERLLRQTIRYYWLKPYKYTAWRRN